MTNHVVIVGGGISGLSTAFYLKRMVDQEGLDVHCTLIERSPRLGGKIDTIRQDGFVMERGPESMLARKTEGIDLIRDLGLESEVAYTNPNERQTFIAHRGMLKTMPTGTNLGIPVQLIPFLQNELLSASGKARALADLVLPSGWRAEDEALGDLLKRRFGDELVSRLCEPLLAGIYAGVLDDLSADATFPQFRTMEREFGSLIQGARQQAKRALRTTKPAAGSSDGSGRSAFITLKGGLNALIERLYDALSDWLIIKLNTSVTTMEPTETGGFRLGVTQDHQTLVLDADSVVLTTPANMARTLLEGAFPSLAQLIDVPYVSTATVLLTFRTEEVAGKIHGSGFVVPRDEAVSITACTYLSNKWSHAAPPGFTVVRCYVGRRGQTEDLEADDDVLVNLATDALRTLCDIKAKPVFSEVTRWNDSMPQYQVGHKERLSQLEEILTQSVPNLYLAGGGYDGVGIPDCIRQAKQVVHRLGLNFISA